eukprot:SAG31_NODE_243_length_19342_cov_12.906459_18_plen_496_part_00
MLLSEAQMQQYLSSGCLVLTVADLPTAVHSNIARQCQNIGISDTNMGNNILDCVPELQRVFNAPTVAGALQSVLGPNYAMHRHRHLHFSSLGRDQVFHKDSHWGLNRMRHHKPRLCMALYYPQPVVTEAGPTAIIPGSSYFEMPLSASEVEQLAAAHCADDFAVREAAVATNVERVDGRLREMKLLVPGGTILLMSYDMFHRGTRQLHSDCCRAMLKFQFYSTEHRVAPSWNSGSRSVGVAKAMESGLGPTDFISSVILAELRGDGLSVDMWLPAELRTVDSAASILRACDTEARRMNAAYALGGSLGKIGAGGTAQQAVEALVAILTETEISAGVSGGDTRSRPGGFDGLTPVQRAAMYGLAIAGSAAVEPLLDALANVSLASPIGNALVLALGEAATSPTSLGPAVTTITTALLGLYAPAFEAAVTEAGPVVKGDRSSGGRERPGQSLGRLVFATVLQSLGIVGQVLIAHGNTSLAEVVVEQAMLPTLSAGRS